MADIDLKTETPDTTINDSAVLFGADSQASASPSVYSMATVRGHIVGTANTFTATQTFTPAVNTSALVGSGYSLTGSASASFVDLSGTWNTSGTPTLIKANVTETGAGSAAGSLLMDLQRSSTTVFSVGKLGATTIGASGNYINADGFNTMSVFQSNTWTVSFAGSSGLRINQNAPVSWMNSTQAGNGSADLFIRRRAAANLQLGAADAATPVAQTLSVQSVVAGTTNTAGANLTITGSQGTGTGAGGSLIFQVAPAGSSGSAQNALATALTISTSGASILSTFAGSISIPSGAAIGNGVNLLAIGSGNIYPANAGLTLGTGSVPFTSLFVTTQVAWSSGGTADTILARDDANKLALRNGTAAQTFNVYGTYTDASNYERLRFAFPASGPATIISEAAGTGAVRPLTLAATGSSYIQFNTANTDRWYINSSGHFLANADNAFDIGAVSATRPRSVYVATSITPGRGVAVASLPTPTTGMIARVTDATAPTIGTTVVGGGAAYALVNYNGANWTVIGV